MHILIIDDHPLVRQGIRVGLSETEGLEGATFSEAESVSEAIQILDGNQIDVATIDLRLGDESGLSVVNHVTSSGMPTRCVVLTSVSTPQAVISAFDTGGVSAFLEKESGSGPVASAVLAASQGLASLTAAAVRAAKDEIRRSGALDPEALSSREMSIAELVADGLADADIAAVLNISQSTVRNNLSAIYRRTGTESRTQLAALVWEHRSNSID